MNQLLNLDQEPTMSSLDFLAEVINPVRAEFGESQHEPRHFLANVEEELDLPPTVKKFRLNNNQTKSYYYELTKEQMLLVGMRESKMVRRKVLDIINGIKERQPHQFTLPKTLPEALRLAADLAEQVELDRKSVV